MKHNKTLRRRHLARIHLLAKELDLTEPAYRNILCALTGERSAADLSEAGRLRVIGFMAGEIARSKPEPQTPAPAAALVEVVTDDEALEILGIAA